MTLTPNQADLGDASLNVSFDTHASLEEQCTSSTHRVISRRTNEAVVDRQAARLAEHPEIMKQRKAVVEHVFGTLRIWGHDILMKGLENIRGEFSLSALAYNLRRGLNLFSVEALLRAIKSGEVATA